MIVEPCDHVETGRAADLSGCGGLGICAVVDAPEAQLLRRHQGRGEVPA